MVGIPTTQSASLATSKMQTWSVGWIQEGRSLGVEMTMVRPGAKAGERAAGKSQSTSGTWGGDRFLKPFF